ncbi:hypothetical protein [Paracoccus siganidrum]|uniref:hypothetical protein n=1 Tax=Paracoccus siganidrum TaxID=1276757 RepID=UPI001604E798|nr:hypothetical protein [Paracoccus siganidrum]
MIEATGENASFGVVGSQRGWGGSCPGRLIETVIQSCIANPVMVVDEIEKAGTPTSMKGLTFGLAEALLPLLEPMTARRWSCPYVPCRTDETTAEMLASDYAIDVAGQNVPAEASLAPLCDPKSARVRG